MKLFQKILVANRGEIAVRIMKSARKLGISTVAIYSEVDKDSLHIKMADEAYCIGVQELSETYLNIDKIIEVARRNACDAIHPGYGFLAENPLFVEACEKNDISFIGPDTNAIRLMGNKIEARKFVKDIGIPMTEGITGTPDELLKNAHTISFPILVKAAAGGGGKGMRIVHQADELKSVLESTSREAKSYFGDDSIYIEKYIEEPRHIEFQVMGDNFGNVVHLFERECTIQRRYQKIIEESPSPTLTPELRQEMGEAAVAISKKVGYSSAGTVEFLVDKKLKFYFLEMNTRIQVEHPVTEMVTGIDLVEEQILVAAGNPLRLKQADLMQKGHAIECRIYAEDPSNNFMPSPGKMTFYKAPVGKNIRLDSSVDCATTVHSFFDPMISKLVIWGTNREKATSESIAALKHYVIHGISTNISYLLGILQHPVFVANQLSTKFCDTHSEEIFERTNALRAKTPVAYPVLASAIFSLYKKPQSTTSSVWETIGYWRNIMGLEFKMDKMTHMLYIGRHQNNSLEGHFQSEPFSAKLLNFNENEISFMLETLPLKAYVSADSKYRIWVTIDGNTYKLVRNDMLNMAEDHSTISNSDDGANLFAPMPGKVIKVNVKAGDKVKRGSVLLVVEAMKMENNIVASNNAIVSEIRVKEGEMVDTEMQLVFLERTED